MSLVDRNRRMHGKWDEAFLVKMREKAEERTAKRRRRCEDDEATPVVPMNDFGWENGDDGAKLPFVKSITQMEWKNGTLIQFNQEPPTTPELPKLIGANAIFFGLEETFDWKTIRL